MIAWKNEKSRAIRRAIRAISCSFFRRRRLVDDPFSRADGAGTTYRQLNARISSLNRDLCAVHSSEKEAIFVTRRNIASSGPSIAVNTFRSWFCFDGFCFKHSWLSLYASASSDYRRRIFRRMNRCCSMRVARSANGPRNYSYNLFSLWKTFSCRACCVEFLRFNWQCNKT